MYVSIYLSIERGGKGEGNGEGGEGEGEGGREGELLRFIMRNWLVQLWKLESPKSAVGASRFKTQES